MRYLTNGYLCQLDASSDARQVGLLDLVGLYNFGTMLCIEKLETGIRDHIDSFRELTIPLFLAFALQYYEKGEEELLQTSLGRLIKKKLAGFLPQMIKHETVNEIKVKRGLLGQQLFEVLLEKVLASNGNEPKASDQTIPIKAEHDDT